MSQTQPESQAAWPVAGNAPAQPLTADEEKLWSVLGHLSYFAFGLIAPLVIMLTVGSRSVYVRHHAVEALNFHITVLIAAVVSGLLIVAVIGVALLPAVLGVGAVLAVVAAFQAYRGDAFRYPLTLRLIS